MHLAHAGLALLLLTSPVLPQTAPPSTLQNDPAHPGVTSGWVETRLFFGLGPVGTTRGISERRWRHFLDSEITPRFPAGLSVLEVYGQWQAPPAPNVPNHPVQRLRSKLVLIYYPPTPENTQRIEAIRSAWKSLTGDQSVLRITTPADVSF